MRRAIVSVLFSVVIAALTQVTARELPAWNDEQGTPRSLDDLRGDVVIVNFWATWCVPCVKELPLLGRIQDRYGERGVRVVGVSVDDPSNKDEVFAFSSAHGVRFEILIGGNTEHMRYLGLGEELPATAILDATGTVVARFRGVVTKRELKRALNSVLRGDAIESDPHTQAQGHHHEEHDQDHDHGEQRNDPGTKDIPVTEASLVPS